MDKVCTHKSCVLTWSILFSIMLTLKNNIHWHTLSEKKRTKLISSHLYQVHTVLLLVKATCLHVHHHLTPLLQRLPASFSPSINHLFLPYTLSLSPPRLCPSLSSPQISFHSRTPPLQKQQWRKISSKYHANQKITPSLIIWCFLSLPFMELCILTRWRRRRRLPHVLRPRRRLPRILQPRFNFSNL